MKPPIFSVIGQRFIACVDNGAIKLHPLINIIHNVVSTLTKLKIDLRLRSWWLEIECEWIRLTDASGAGKDLPRRQKSKQRSENWWRELRLPFHQIILMATKRGPGVMIDIVLDKRDTVLGA